MWVWSNWCMCGPVCISPVKKWWQISLKIWRSMRPLVQLGSKLSPCSFSFHETCLFLISVSNFCCIYSSPWVVNLAKATLGTAAALFSDPSCAVCCLSPGITQLAHYFIYLFFYIRRKRWKQNTPSDMPTNEVVTWLCSRIKYFYSEHTEEPGMTAWAADKSCNRFYIRLSVNRRRSKLDVHYD